MPWKIQYSSYEEPQGKSLNNKKKKTNIFFNFPSIQEMTLYKKYYPPLDELDS